MSKEAEKDQRQLGSQLPQSAGQQEMSDANWERVRSAIEHENTLVHHRIGWMLSTEGFAVGGFFALQAVLFRQALPPLAVILIEFCTIGVFWIVNLVVNEAERGIVAAAEHQATLSHWWEKKTGLKPCLRPFEIKDKSEADLASDDEFQDWIQNKLDHHSVPPINGTYAPVTKRMDQSNYAKHINRANWAFMAFALVCCATICTTQNPEFFRQLADRRWSALTSTAPARRQVDLKRSANGSEVTATIDATSDADLQKRIRNAIVEALK